MSAPQVLAASLFRLETRQGLCARRGGAPARLLARQHRLILRRAYIGRRAGGSVVVGVDAKVVQYRLGCF